MPRRPSASRYQKQSVEHLRVRATLLDLVLREIRACQFDQWVVASILGTSQQRVSALLHRHNELFNSETLILMLQRFGVYVDVVETRRERVRLLDFKRAP